jgi:hypothetical protein
VNDRSEKNDSRNEVERLALNPSHEFSENRRNLLVMVAINRQGKVYSRPRYPRGPGYERCQTQRHSEAKKKQRYTRNHPLSLLKRGHFQPVNLGWNLTQQASPM